MARGEKEYLSNLQGFFNEPDFELMIERLQLQMFEEWRRTRKLDARERIFAKLEVVDQVVSALRAAADTVTFEKQTNKEM